MALARVLEPEVMDTAEEAREYDQMDHQSVNRAFVDDLIASWTPDSDPSSDPDSDADSDTFLEVLDLGTGTALIPIELCRRWKSCRVLAAELAVSMLDLAVYNVEVASLTGQIELRHVDAKQLPYADEMFDLVMSNSIVHHIADPSDVFREAIRVTRPGGQLFFRDLARPRDDAEIERLVRLYAADEKDSARDLFEQSLRAALTLIEVQELLESLGFEPLSVRMSSDRHWTWSAVKSGARS